MAEYRLNQGGGVVVSDENPLPVNIGDVEFDTSGLATEVTADRIADAGERTADALEEGAATIPPMDAEEWGGPNGWTPFQIAFTGAGDDTLGAAEADTAWVVGGFYLSFSAACVLTFDDAAFDGGSADMTLDVPGACIWPEKVGGIAPVTITENTALIVRTSAGNTKGVILAKKVPA